jgi:hypothetical protein
MNFIDTKLKKACWLSLLLLLGFLTDWALFVYGGILLAIFFGLKIMLKVLGWCCKNFFFSLGVVYGTIINDIGKSVATHSRKDNR